MAGGLTEKNFSEKKVLMKRITGLEDKNTALSWRKTRDILQALQVSCVSNIGNILLPGAGADTCALNGLCTSKDMV